MTRTPAHIRDLMAEAWRLREVLDPHVPDHAYDPRVHLARRFREVMEELGILADVGAYSGSRATVELESNVDGMALLFRMRRTKEGEWVREIKRKRMG